MKCKTTKKILMLTLTLMMMFVTAFTMSTRVKAEGITSTVYWGIDKETDGTLYLSSNELATEQKAYKGGSFDGGVVLGEAPWKDYYASTKTIDIISKVSPSSINNWFSGNGSVTEIKNISNLDTSNVTNMSNAFGECYSLKSLDLSSLDTSKVQDMSDMFSLCTSLESINLANLNTSNVGNMGGMFSNCYSLKSLDLSSFDTASVTSMEKMFVGSKSLLSLDLTNFNTSKVTTMMSMFKDCDSLTSVNVSSFNTTNVTDMDWMFSECVNLLAIDVTGFNTTNLIRMSNMFMNCAKLKVLDLSSFEAPKLEYFGSTLHWCKNLEELSLSAKLNSKIYSLDPRLSFPSTSKGFDGKWHLKKDGTDEGYSSLADMEKRGEVATTYYAAAKAYTITYKVINGTFGQNGESTLTEVVKKDASITNVPTNMVPDKNHEASGYWDVTPSTNDKVTADKTYTYTFNRTKGSTITPTIYWGIDEDGVLYLGDKELTAAQKSGGGGSFAGDDVFKSEKTPWYKQRNNIKKANIVSKISPASTAYWFQNLGNMTEIKDLSNLDTSNVTDFSYMFSWCSNLTTLDLSTFDTSNGVSMESMFEICTRLKSLDLSKFNTSKVTNMSGMFAGDTALEKLDISNFDVGKVNNMTDIFDLCTKIEELKVSGKFNSKISSGGTQLIFPSTSKGFDGKWHLKKDGTDEGYSSLADMEKRGEVATTYYAAAKAYTITYKVINGTFGQNGESTLTEVVKKDASITNVPTNMVPDKNHEASGYWDVTPSTNDKVTADKTYTYTFNVTKPTPDPVKPNPSTNNSNKKDESCEKVIGPTWHWNNAKGVCEEYSTVGTATR